MSLMCLIHSTTAEAEVTLSSGLLNGPPSERHSVISQICFLISLLWPLERDRSYSLPGVDTFQLDEHPTDCASGSEDDAKFCLMWLSGPMRVMHICGGKRQCTLQAASRPSRVGKHLIHGTISVLHSAA